MMFHGLTETRIVKTGNGQKATQERFYCHFHGWYDLFVFPNAEADHSKCNQIIEPSAASLELPKTFAAVA